MIVKLLPILGIRFIDMLGYSILIPLMPFFVKHFGAPDVVVGGLIGVYALCQFVAGPIWGNVSDRIGRKRVMVVSQVGSTIGWTMLGFAPTIGWVVASRIVEGFSGGNLSVTQAYVSDVVEPEKRSRAFAYVGAAFAAGLIFGPAMGGYLVQHFGYTVPFVLAAGLQVVTLLFTIFMLPESRKIETDNVPATFRDIPRAFTVQGVAPVLLQKLFFSLGLYGWLSAFTLVLHLQYGFQPAGASYFFCLFGVVSVIAQLFAVGRISERAGERWSCNLGYALLLLGLVPIPFAHAIWSPIVMISLLSLGLALVNATIPAQLSHLGPEHARGTLFGGASSMESISAVCSPLVATYALQVGGVLPATAIPFAFVTIALLVGIDQAMRAPLFVENATDRR